MIVICDKQQIVRHFVIIGRYVKAQTNGVTIGCKEREATAYYCQDDDTYWPLKEAYAGQQTYHIFEVEEVPEGCEVNICRYNMGQLEVDEDLKADADAAQKAQHKEESVQSQLGVAARLIAEQQTDESIMMMMADLYEQWEPNVAYQIGKIVSYGVNADGETQLYQVVQAHTSADYWLPDVTPSMYKAIGFDEGGYPVWTQPLGTTDAYKIGDIVSHNGKLWICTQGTGDGLNTWEPGVYGWEEYTE